MNDNPFPILYSLRQCPYCIRARLGLLLAQQPVMLREIVTRNKPDEMLATSAKGTVPILLLSDGTVVDESIDIMVWALTQNDPDNLLLSGQKSGFKEMLKLINLNDKEFVCTLNAYKAASRYHDDSVIDHRQECERFIIELEHRLTARGYLMGDAPSLVDYALLPFIRQFSRVDRKWYANAPYPNLRYWLTKHYQQSHYTKTMTKYPEWLDNREAFLFCDLPPGR
ncbi:glutathione S-transferase [Vibrio sp. F74]|uniref:glutathione S-transferase n=1 Tax=Vibrio sp. F74 TaxID=700020 RepID=UPI0035F5EF2F